MALRPFDTIFPSAFERWLDSPPIRCRFNCPGETYAVVGLDGDRRISARCRTLVDRCAVLSGLCRRGGPFGGRARTGRRCDARLAAVACVRRILDRFHDSVSQETLRAAASRA